MTGTTLLTLLVGVAFARANAGSQSAFSYQDEQPIDDLENHVGQSRVDTPQVVLQLKYDRGELNKIYLAQFRNGQSSWEPSVPARTNLCADLCHAGLGGSACGSTCLEMLPVGLKTALQTQDNDTRTDDGVYGEPRSAVCPALCKNQLGEPLCNCSSIQVSVIPNDLNVDWSGVCDAFCVTDGYTLSGCPSCESGTTATSMVKMARILNTKDGWVMWCSVQCRQGHGGAACNCDRSPLQ
ncbi:hypothetical protein O0L34_g18551 [Tuta absoluta]|nr:hypothetical protein O0L34_g18551 [Tuta absoluta]